MKKYSEKLLITLLILVIASIVFLFTVLGGKYYQDEYNLNGDMHPRLLKSEDLGDWIVKHCDVETVKIASYIMWYAEYNGIKKEVPFVISWADTQCGKNLTTSYNYGNVGNTDRGNRKGFNNAFDGWMAIVDTLNNKNMYGINKIGHMSQGGRNKMSVDYSCYKAPVPYKCYASSEYNWNKNVLRALTVIMRSEIDENYLIRNF